MFIFCNKIVCYLFICFVTVYFWAKKSRQVELELKQLKLSLKVSEDKCAAERQGRIRAQQVLNPFPLSLIFI